VGLFSLLSNGCPGFPVSKVVGAQQVTPGLHLNREFRKTGALHILPFTPFVAYLICNVEVRSNKERRNVNIGVVEPGSNSVAGSRRTA
jgi:hypothetical protein